MTKQQKLIAKVLKRQVRVVNKSNIDNEYNEHINNTVLAIARDFAFEFFGDPVNFTIDEEKAKEFIKACGV